MSEQFFTLETDGAGLTWLKLDLQGSAFNTLGRAMIEALSAQLDVFANSPPKGLIITSDKRGSFVAGADVEEFRVLKGSDDAKALVKRGYDFMDKLAAVPYPTLALVHGVALGGGLELALACRYRVAVDDTATRLGLPEVLLGIVPGWGGMARLPRLVGAPAALDLMLTGKTVDARKAKKIGLVDEAAPPRVAESTARGLLLANPLPHELSFPQKLTLMPPIKNFIASQARKQVAKRARIEHYPAPYTILDMWEKHDGNPFGAPDSDPRSMRSLAEHATTPNLLRVFTLQERLKSEGKSTDWKAAHVHVVGAGVMGGDIAAWCALRGLTVTLQDQSADRLTPAMGRAAKLFKDRLKDERRVRDAMDRLQADVAGTGIARADLIIEAIFENLEAKQQLFAKLEAAAKPECVLASNTSSIPLEQIAAALKDPSRLVGIHFFNPVSKMMLVEIVVGAQTASTQKDRATAFTRQIDKLPLPVKSAPGFLVNRLLAPYMLEAMRCADEGIALETIDEAALAFGMPMGPIELADTVGLDVGMAVGKIVKGPDGKTVSAPAKLQALFDAKKLGKKSGEGFYKWVDDKPQKQSNFAKPEAGLGERLVKPFLDEAQKALAEGIVSDADLLDAGAIFGCGFAPFTGGPLHYLKSRR